MSGVSPVGLLALAVMVVLYAVEDRFRLALLGFSAACVVVAVTDLVRSVAVWNRRRGVRCRRISEVA